MIQLQDISKAFGERRVLRHVSLTLPPGATALTGASGSGKTTLLRILLGLTQPDAGAITGVPARAAAVFQDDLLADTLTVRANLRMTQGAAYKAANAQRHLELLGLPGLLRAPIGTLSGGMRRRVALARAVLQDAPLLALDEPFKGLDDDAKRLAVAYVLRFTQGKTVLLITHDQTECDLMGARRVRMEDINR